MVGHGANVTMAEAIDARTQQRMFHLYPGVKYSLERAGLNWRGRGHAEPREVD